MEEKKLVFCWEGLGQDFDPDRAVAAIDQGELDFLEAEQDRRPGMADELAVVTYLDLQVNGCPEMREQHFTDRWRDVFAAIASVPNSLCSLRATARVYEMGS